MTQLQCPVCEGRETVLICERPDVPVFMNRLGRSSAEARAIPRGKLRFTGCEHCGFVWNADFRPELITYDLNYENDQAHSTIFSEHLRARAKDVVAMVPPSAPIDYLEIGCGQGQFIELVAKTAGDRLRSAVGFDPAWRGEDGKRHGLATIHKVYFTAETAGRLAQTPNVAASRHTIEHIPDPVAFLTTVREALPGSGSIPLLLETPRVEWIFENRAVHDLFYEHCSLFSEQSMQIALSRAGFVDIDVQALFGGQYQWARARTPSKDAGSLAKPAGPAGADWIRNFKADYQTYAGHWRDAVTQANRRGPVMIWGAGAKGVSFASLIDPDRRLIAAAIDINPAKQNLFLPASGLEVLSPEKAAKHGVETVFLMNPNYRAEVETKVAELGLKATVIPI